MMKEKKIELVAERLFLFDPNADMTVIVTVEGNVTADEIKAAVEKTYTQNQTTMSKAVLDKKGRLYLEKMEKTECKVYIDKRDWREIRFENERKTLRINEGEFVRTFIIPKEHNTEIYIMAHHLMCDGFGLFIMIEDIMNNLDGKAVEYKPTKVLTKSDGKKGDLDFKARLGLRYLNSKWKKQGEIFGWEDYYRINEEFWKTRRTNIVIEEIKGDALRDMKIKSKEMGVTVNSYLVTKLLQENPGCKNFSVPMSLRGEERSISNLVTSVTINCSYDTKKTFEENARIIDQEIKKMVRDEKAKYHIAQFLSVTDPTLVDGSLMHYVLGYENGTAKYVAGLIGYIGDNRINLGVSNMKELPIPSEYNRFKITDIIPVSPSILSAERVLGISTYHGRMIIAESRIEEM